MIRPQSIARRTNRTKLWRPGVDQLEERCLMAVDFDYAMAARFGLDLNNNGIIDLPNTATYAQPTSFSVNLSVSGDTTPGPNVTYDFNLQPATGGQPTRLIRKASDFVASPTPLSLAQGTYRVTFQRFDNGTRTDAIARLITIRDILIVSMGDSVASGEGNPEVPQTGLKYAFSSTSPLYTNNLNTFLNAADFSADLTDIYLSSRITSAKWADAARDVPSYGPGPYDNVPGFENMQLEHEDAHRSTANATAQFALRLEQSDPHTSVTYVSVAQSGATVQSALNRGLNMGKQRTSYGMPSQVDELSRIIGKRSVDQLFISLGANDIGFSSLVTSFLGDSYFAADPIGAVTNTGAIVAAQTAALKAASKSTIVNGLILPRFNKGASELPASYRQLNQALRQNLNVNPTNVFITQYPDTLRIQKPMNNGTTTVPWWGSAVTDILPGTGVSATVAFIASQFISGNNAGQVVPSKLVRVPLNQLVQRGAVANGWNYISGITDQFLGQGYSSNSNIADESVRWSNAVNVTPPGTGSNRLVRTARESVLLQGPIDASLTPATVRTIGTLHPNIRGHLAMSQVIYNALAPSVNVNVRGNSRFVLLRGIADSARALRNRGLTFEWDFDRTPNSGAFKADAVGRAVLVNPSALRTVATLKVTNRNGVSREFAISPQTF